MVDLDDVRALAGADSGRLLTLARSGVLARGLARDARVTQSIEGSELGSASVLVSDLLPVEYADVLAALLVELGTPVAGSLAELARTADYPRAADLIVVVSVSGGERALLDAVQLAAGRGATVVVAAPEGSPIAAVAIERRAVLFTAPDDPDSAWWAAYAACVATFGGASALDSLADALDDSAAAFGPVVATYENPAKQLAGLDAPLLFVATDAPTAAMGRALVAELGATPARAVRCIDVRRGFGELLAVGSGPSAAQAQDLFYDPLIDGSTGAPANWQLVLLPTVRGNELADDAVRAAESIGALLSLSLTGDRGQWTAAGLILLAQMSGAYRALQQQERE